MDVDYQNTGITKRASAPRWCSWLFTRLTRPVAIRHIWILALVLALPTLWAGLIADDHYQATRFKAPWFLPTAGHFSPFDLFSVSDGTDATNVELMSQGAMPWWTDTNFRFQMWRPLTELSHWLDYRLWPNSPWLMHLHQLLWFAILLWAVLRFFRRFASFNAIIPLSFAFYALSANLSQTVTWLASRNTLMATALGIAALLTHVKARETERPRYLLVAWCLFILALLTSEFGLGTGAWLLAWTLTLDRGAWWKRLLWLVPYGAAFLGWALVYLHGHYGVARSEFYIDPTRVPGQYLLMLVQRLPTILFQAILCLPAAFLGSTHIGGLGWIIALISSVFFLWLIRHRLREPNSRFLLLGSLLSILPIAAGPGGGRTLAFVSLGITPFLADLIQQWVKGRFSSRRQARQVATLAWPITVMMLLGMAATPVTAMLMSYNDSKNVTGPAEHLPISSADDHRQVVLLNPNSILYSILYPVVRAEQGLPLSGRMYALTSGQRDITITRDSKNSIRVKPDGGFLVEQADYFMRAKSDRFRVGQQIRLPGMTVEILTLNAQDRPMDVRFSFAHNLDSHKLSLLQCEELHYVPFKIPAVGESVTLPPCER